MTGVILRTATCLLVVAGMCSAYAGTRTYTQENVDNWGRVDGQTTRAVKSCPIEVPSQIALLFEWSRAKHGHDHEREYDVGYKEIDAAMTDPARVTGVCENLLKVIGPSGSQAENLIVPKTQTAAAEPTPGPLKLTAAQLLKSVGNNELRLRREAEEADGLLVTGKVENVENGYFGSGPVVTLRVGSFSNVMAHIEKSEVETAVKLNSGDTVTMLCRNPTNIAKGYSAAVYGCVFR